MTVPVKQPVQGDIIEAVIAKGDLAKLTVEERNQYYGAVCRSIGLNPLTRPFEYITLQGKMTLYAKRDAADQLRKINGISVAIVSQEYHDGLLTVHVRAKDANGREDEDLGVVSLPETMKGDIRANAILKAVTKAKRRVTLSISGLGFLDENEVEDIPAANRSPARPAPNVMLPPHDPETGEIIDAPHEAAVPSSSDSSRTPEEEGPSMTELDEKLAAAAENGMVSLQEVWKALDATQKKMLKAALDRRHKPRALEVDAGGDD